MNMQTTMIKIAFLTATVATLSACAPMTPAPVHTAYAPPPVETPDPYTAPVDYTPVVTPPQQQYVVQLTASSSRNKAENLKNRFARDGYSAFVSPLQVNGRLLHRVQIGYYNSQNDAGLVLAQLQQNYPGDAYVNAALVKTP